MAFVLILTACSGANTGNGTDKEPTMGNETDKEPATGNEESPTSNETSNEDNPSNIDNEEEPTTSKEPPVNVEIDENDITTETEDNLFDITMDLEIPSKAANTDLITSMMPHIKSVVNYGDSDVSTNLKIYLIELAGDKPRTTYKIDRDFDKERNTSYHGFTAHHHNMNNTTTPIDNQVWLECISPTVHTISTVFDLNYDTHLEYVKNSRTTLQESSDGSSYHSIAYIPKDMDSASDLIPPYFILTGSIGEQHPDKLEPYTGDKAEIMISLEPSEKEPIDYDAYFNLADLTYEAARSYHPYQFAIEGILRKEVSDVMHISAETFKTSSKKEDIEVVIKANFRGDLDSDSDKELYKSQLSELLNTMDKLQLTDKEITTIIEGFDSSSKDIETNFQNIIIENEKFIALVEYDGFMFGLRTTILYKSNGDGSFIPYR